MAGFFQVDSDHHATDDVRIVCAEPEPRAVLRPGAARHSGKFGEVISRTLISSVSAAPRP